MPRNTRSSVSKGNRWRFFESRIAINQRRISSTSFDYRSYESGSNSRQLSSYKFSFFSRRDSFRSTISTRIQRLKSRQTPPTTELFQFEGKNSFSLRSFFQELQTFFLSLSLSNQIDRDSNWLSGNVSRIKAKRHRARWKYSIVDGDVIAKIVEIGSMIFFAFV